MPGVGEAARHAALGAPARRLSPDVTPTEISGWISDRTFSASLAATARRTSSPGATAAASPRAESPRKLRREVLVCHLCLLPQKRDSESFNVLYNGFARRAENVSVVGNL